MIPCPIAETDFNSLPQYVVAVIHSLDHFIVERAKTARAFIKSTNHPKSLQNIAVEEMDKHDDQYAKTVLHEWLDQGKNIGIISEAGCPGIADPGSELVAIAHRKNIQVIPLIGPSSILLALMGSGMNGQSFTFHGYLPNKKDQISSKLKAIEKKIASQRSAEIFIETPYRNLALFSDIIKTCSSELNLCIAADITGNQEYIKTQKVKTWKKVGFPLKDKVPVIFILGQ